MTKITNPFATIIGAIFAGLLIIGVWATAAVAMGFFAGLVVSAYRIVTGDL